MIKLTSKHLQQITQQAEKTYPEECCGLLLGKLEPDTNHVIEVRATENSWNNQDFEFLSLTEGSKRDRFTIAPEVILKIQKEARDRNLLIIGVYHSHPDHPAIPSEFDRLIAWSQYSYIVVSVQAGKAVDLRSWKLDDSHQFESEEILLIDETF
ncbi:Mov34/MPN/PAD-1 family protein [Gloeothece citriformis PCC 7424]|uniref:Mov34/MPN/PAD-1 family protein n=1 Tax=Gloeothece citriformis (strain PCC 7424) TaxID=65393 RepID=B7KGD4_GLOC7|nr:M67 family metallopeptidase [Gloeothece citriformis]ACK70605.1 Mov34/MPN/PAD-1 family protein [Gloeothece citriformis PCC 7424]